MLDLDTFLATLYTMVDDIYQENFAPLRAQTPGRPPCLSDSEVLTLAICAQWLARSERAFIRYAVSHWRPYFPRLLSQSAYNRRVRNLCGVLLRLVPLVATKLRAAWAPYQVVDTVPVPLMRRCRGQRHKLFGLEAAIGRGGSDREWYYGCKLLLATAADGAITGFLLAPANAEDRWVAESFLCWRDWVHGSPATPQDMPPSHRRGGTYRGVAGSLWPQAAVGEASAAPYLMDRGFSGRWWEEHWWGDYHARVLTPQRYRIGPASVPERQLAGWRQVIETVNANLRQVFGLSAPRCRSKWGLTTRVASKLAAWNMAIYLNRYFQRPDFAVATLFPA